MLESFAAAFLEDLDLSGSQVRGDLGHVHVLKMLKKLPATELETEGFHMELDTGLFQTQRAGSSSVQGCE